MDARQVRYFLAVVDQGGITRAAETLYVAQPSLSQAIKSLERELGVALFRKSGRGIELTPTGHSFVGPARRAAQGLMDSVEIVKQINGLHAGHLDIVTPPSLIIEPISELVAQFRAKYSEVVVNILGATTSEDSVDMVRQARCEIGFLFMPCESQGMVIHTLERRRLVSLGIAGDWPTPLPDVVPLEMLGTLPLVIGPPGDGVREMVDLQCGKLGVTPNIVVEASSYSTVRDLVLNGTGAALLPHPISENLSEAGGRIYPCYPELTQQYGVVMRSDFLSTPARAFLEFLQFELD